MNIRIDSYLNKKFRLYPKTQEILELREELYSMMNDKFNDCIANGLSEEECFKQAITIMDDYKSALKEIETGSSLSALRKKLSTSLAFSAFYFIVLICVYLFLSLVTFDSFDKTWLIGVGGVFVYIIYFVINMFSYAKMFKLSIFSRIALGGLFIGFVPILYVFPSLILSELYNKNVWVYSWLIIPVILFIYLVSDLLAFGRKRKNIIYKLELIFSGLVFTTALYLIVSYIFNLWNIMWIIYVAYLAIVMLILFIKEKTKIN